MKKFPSAITAAACALALAVAPATPVAQAEPAASQAQAAAAAPNTAPNTGRLSSQPRYNRDNADKIPEGVRDEFTGPSSQAPFGSAYTGVAGISVLLAVAATAGVANFILNLPQVQPQVQRAVAQARQAVQQFLP